jgi:hypothetical protein
LYTYPVLKLNAGVHNCINFLSSFPIYSDDKTFYTVSGDCLATAFPLCALAPWVAASTTWAAAAIATELHCRMKVTGLLIVSASHISQNCVCVKVRPPQFSLQTLCSKH